MDFQNFQKIKTFWRYIFVILSIQKPSQGSRKVLQICMPDRFDPPNIIIKLSQNAVSINDLRNVVS